MSTTQVTDCGSLEGITRFRADVKLAHAAASSSNDAVNIEDDDEDTEASPVFYAEKHRDNYQYRLAFDIVRDRFAQQVCYAQTVHCKLMNTSCAHECMPISQGKCQQRFSYCSCSLWVTHKACMQLPLLLLFSCIYVCCMT